MLIASLKSRTNGIGKSNATTEFSEGRGQQTGEPLMSSRRPSLLIGVAGRVLPGGHCAWSGWGKWDRRTFSLLCEYVGGATAHLSERISSHSPPTCIWRASHLFEGKRKCFHEKIIAYLYNANSGFFLYESFVSYLYVSSYGLWGVSSWNKFCCSSHGDKYDCVHEKHLAAVGFAFAPKEQGQGLVRWLVTWFHWESRVPAVCGEWQHLAVGWEALRGLLPSDLLQGRPGWRELAVEEVVLFVTVRAK